MLKKPEKKEVCRPTDEQVGNGAYYDLREIKGYNQAIEEYEAWLKEAGISIDDNPVQRGIKRIIVLPPNKNREEGSNEKRSSCN